MSELYRTMMGFSWDVRWKIASSVRGVAPPENLRLITCVERQMAHLYAVPAFTSSPSF
jgi:hypothetical protein